MNPAAAASDPAPLSFTVNVEKRGPDLQFDTAMGFEWTHVHVRVPGLPDELHGFRAVHLADTHCRHTWDPAYDVLIDRLASDPPHCVLFTGDFVESKRDHRSAWRVVQKLFTSLRSQLGTFAILGNHDGDLLAPYVCQWNVTLIDRATATLRLPGAAVQLIGLPGVDRKDLSHSWVESLGPAPTNTLRIALSHFPDNIRRAGLGPSIWLSGHTHGGQVALPGRIPIIRHDSLPARRCSGIHKVGSSIQVVNRGIGFSSPLKLRIFCPAEVVEVHFVG